MDVRKALLSTLLLSFGVAACDEAPVTLPEPTSVTIGAADLQMTVGDLAPLAAQVLDQNNAVVAGATPTFSSDNPGVATVDPGGMVRAVNPGTANLTAAYGSMKATARVTVARDDRGFVKSLDVLADSVAADVRTGTRFVSLRAYNGHGQPVCPAVSVATSDPLVATGGNAGGCTVGVVPHFAGTATLVVSADGVRDSVRVRVTSTGTVVYFATHPDPYDVTAGKTVSYVVRLLDQQGQPLANRVVRVDVTAGSVSPASATTDGNGSVAVAWTLPSDLRAYGSVQAITVATQLPSGAVYNLSESVFVRPGPVTALSLFRRNAGTGRFEPITTPSIQARLYEWVDIGAMAVDQYGNTGGYTFNFSVPANGWYNCTSSGYTDASGIVFDCGYAYNTGTYTLTVASGGTTRSVDIVIVP